MWMNNIAKFAALPLVLLCLAGAARPAPSLTFEGLGPVRIGMTEKELLMLGFSDPQRSADWQTDEEYLACHYLVNEKDYPDAGFMINESRLVRIDLGADAAGGTWKSLSGAMIGMTETEVVSIYGSRLILDDHPYLGDAGSYLVLLSGDGRHKMIFETATPDESGEQFSSAPSQGPNGRKRVTSFRAGLVEPVGYIEGCS
tara:strand:+ start:4332 stop:4931 length:600 start_codon:yes stop_codon:yes gene_type:complete